MASTNNVVKQYKDMGLAYRTVAERTGKPAARPIAHTSAESKPTAIAYTGGNYTYVA